MKIQKIIKLLIFTLYCSGQNSLALTATYSDPKTWDKKKLTVINLSTDFIANRERFSSTCYKDGHGWSAGYGDFSWCDEAMQVLRWKHSYLKLYPDAFVRKQVRITKEQAKWRLKKFVIIVYDNLEKKVVNGKRVVDYLDEKELVALIDNIYTRGETLFYKDPLWISTVATYVKINKIDCIKTAHVFLNQSKNAKGAQRQGVLARRLVELLDFTHKSCAYDIKFLEKMFKKYQG
jgi:hypothetical protein